MLYQKKNCELFSWSSLASSTFERLWWTWGLLLLQIMIAGAVRKQLTGVCRVWLCINNNQGSDLCKKTWFISSSQESNSNCLIPNLFTSSLEIHKIQRANNISWFSIIIKHTLKYLREKCYNVYNFPLDFSRGEKLSDFPNGSFIHAFIVHSLNKHHPFAMPYSTWPPQINCLL